MSKLVRMRQAHSASGSRATSRRTGGASGWREFCKCRYNLETSERGRYMVVETIPPGGKGGLPRNTLRVKCRSRKMQRAAAVRGEEASTRWQPWHQVVCRREARRKVVIGRESKVERRSRDLRVCRVVSMPEEKKKKKETKRVNAVSMLAGNVIVKTTNTATIKTMTRQ